MTVEDDEGLELECLHRAGGERANKNEDVKGTTWGKCWARVKPVLLYCWCLAQLGFALWMVFDMVFDCLQQVTYYGLSSYWNSTHNSLSLETRIHMLCGELRESIFLNEETDWTGNISWHWKHLCHQIEIGQYQEPKLTDQLYGIDESKIDTIKEQAICSAREEFHKMNETISLCVLDLSPAYFVFSVATWLIPPILYAVYALYAFMSLETDPIDFKSKPTWLKAIIIVLLPILAPLGLLLVLTFSILVVFIKTPLDSIEFSITQLRWTWIWPKRCSEWYRNAVRKLKFTDIDVKVHNKFMKLFEQFGEAIPQFVTSLIFYLSNLGYVHQKDRKIFGIPQTVITMVLSCVSVFMGVISCLNAARKVYNRGLIGADGRSPIHVEAESGNLKKVKSMIKNGSKLHPKDEMDNTPLIVASGAGHADVVDLLVTEGLHLFNVNDQTKFDHETALTLAARGGHPNVIDRLIAGNAY